MGHGKTLHVDADGFLKLIDGFNNAAVAVSLGPTDGLVMTNNNFGGGKIIIDKARNANISSNQNLGSLEIPGGGKSIIISENDFINALSSFSSTELNSVAKSLQNPKHNKSHLISFFNKFVSQMAIDSVSIIALHALNNELIYFHLPRLPL